MSTSSTEQERAQRFFDSFGKDTVSSQALEPGLSYWFEGERACVAYRDVGGAWIAVGGPLCSPDDRLPMMQAFAEEARRSGKRVRFFAVEEDVAFFHSSDQNEAGFSAVSIGVQPEWQPEHWPEALKSKASLREQLRRARAKGVIVREVSAEVMRDEQSAVHHQVCRMVRDWQKNGAMAPMSFLVSLDLFGHAGMKRYFVAEQAQGAKCPGQASLRVVAILIAAPIPARHGWFFEDVLRAHDAPNGSIELLFDHAMGVAASEGQQLISFGLAPLAGDEIHPWLAAIRDRLRWLYDFEGLRAFKAKLLPTNWRPMYLAYPKRESAIRPTIDSLSAFADGSWWSFGLKTVVHAQPTLIWWLAVLLLPWTLLLTYAPIGSYFPSAAIKSGWIAFDLLLFVALMDLCLDWKRGKAKFAAALAGLDAVLGSAQFLAHNRHYTEGALSLLLTAVALLAPLGAAFILAIGAGMRDRLYISMPEHRSQLP